jgi:hypothetical protein
MRNETRNDANEERSEQLRNERRVLEAAPEPTTFFAMAQHGVDLTLTGEASATGFVVGSTPHVNYPRSGYDVGVEVGIEPALGVPIDALEPVGTAVEIEQSLSQLAGAARSDADNSHRVVETASVIPTDAEDKLKAALARGLRRRKL